MPKTEISYTYSSFALLVLERLTKSNPFSEGSQTLPRDGTKGGHLADEIVRADSHDEAGGGYNNNNTLKRPTSRARDGYGSVRDRDRDVPDGGRMPERENPVSNATGPRRPNGKAGGHQPIQQQVQVI